ncbi:hypothetical protein ACQPV1_19780 [Clostridium neonatale]|uniref:hypothetical protein n=1 Tax=Clostridium neonatale TaxID=137838 RepID=UPI003D3542A0
MGDEFHIDNIEEFNCDILPVEISDVSKIIKEMISIKNSGKSISGKKKKSYDINDKIKLNNISSNIASKIIKYHLESYDIIDDAISCLQEQEFSIREDLYDYYWEVYIDILIEYDIDNKDIERVKETSNNIYSALLKKIKSELFNGKKSDIPTNKVVTYIGAITAYVFYKCKFLIPVENISC